VGRQAEIFLRQASYCDPRSALYGGLCRRLATDPRVAALAPDLRWDFPLRLLGGLHALVLAGRASWDDVDAALDEHADELARFAAEHGVQTNEVQRAWALLPGLLALGAERVDIVEIGASAGLLLALDAYGYRYRAGTWGSGDERLVLSGDDAGGPPVDLLACRLRVERRRGVDREPIALDDAGARLLEAFVWPDQPDRIERLRRAIEIARGCEIAVERGDYVARLPALLADRREDVPTVVVSSVTTTYLPEERYHDLRAVLAHAGAEGPLAWLSLESPRGDPGYGGLALDLTTWPDGGSRRLAQVDYHASWLRWL
jgi:hypothetical protein